MTMIGMTSSTASDLLTLRDIIQCGEHPAEGAAIVPDGYKLESLERFQDQPNRLRGTFTARTIDQIAAYAWVYCSEVGTVLYVDDEKLSASMILDHGTPEDPLWGEHKAILSLRKTPEWEAIHEAVRGIHPGQHGRLHR